MAAPTAYPDLNDLLGELVEGVREILASDFVGAYLLGSFALGGADLHSDVDFLIVTRGDVNEEQLARLQAMHARLYELEVPWAQHLEGSYAPKEVLRRADPSRWPFPFLDNGASQLVPDNHCNTAVVRWTLRERGVVLAGPDPSSFVEEMPAAELRDEMRWMLDEYAEWAREPTDADPMSRWKQPYLVLTVCRILRTSATGTVASKNESATWALQTLDMEWASLIQRALEDRPDPWRRVREPAEPALSERTLAFVDYAQAV
jgi:predicted nucleotidyltransferase